jgi:hypothetical protein
MGDDDRLASEQGGSVHMILSSHRPQDARLRLPSPGYPHQFMIGYLHFYPQYRSYRFRYLLDTLLDLAQRHLDSPLRLLCLYYTVPGKSSFTIHLVLAAIIADRLG